jgi:hypothetical protein
MKKTIETVSSINIEAPPSVVFEAVCGIDASTIFQKRWPLPGVVSVSGHVGPWSATGQKRILRLTDKSVVCEELTDFQPENSYAYRIYGFTGPMKNIADEGRGEWSVVGDDDSSSLAWRYSLTTTQPQGQIALAFFVEFLWPGYMRAALKRTKELVEAK